MWHPESKKNVGNVDPEEVKNVGTTQFATNAVIDLFLSFFFFGIFIQSVPRKALIGYL